MNIIREEAKPCVLYRWIPNIGKWKMKPVQRRTDGMVFPVEIDWPYHVMRGMLLNVAA